MTPRRLAGVAVCAMVMVMSGCVSAATHDETLAELKEAHKHWARTTASFEHFQQKAVADIKALEEEQTRLLKELLTVRNGMAQTQTDLESTRYHLRNEQQIRRKAELKLSKLLDDYEQLERISSDIQTKVANIVRRIETTQKDLASSKRSLTDAHTRIARLEQEKKEATAALAKARAQARNLEAALAAEQEIWARLQKALRNVERPVEPVIQPEKKPR
jgi:chromosome segregation ATPase